MLPPLGGSGLLRLRNRGFCSYFDPTALDPTEIAEATLFGAGSRKRHLLVETVGLLLKVKVYRADIQDSDGVPLLLTGLQPLVPRLQHVWVDGGYRKTAQDWITQHLGWTVQVVKHPHKPRGAWAAPDMVIDWTRCGPKAFVASYRSSGSSPIKT